MVSRASEAVFVEAPARLHFGVLDLRGEGGRWFGGIGAAAAVPQLVVSVSDAASFEGEGPDAERAVEFARRFLAHHGLRGGARVHVHQALPRHAGLGSGTQLALAVARALADLHGLPSDARGLARAAGRARRSAVGTWIFANGGLVLEGGRPIDRDDCGPLIARLPFPAEWRSVIAIPHAADPGLSGATEDAAFASLPAPPLRDVERVAHVVLMRLLPSAADGDLHEFGRALTEVQTITGSWFSSIQGGPYTSGPSAELVRRMPDWGALGVGQSSWGPAVYGLVEGDEAARDLAARARTFLDGRGEIHVGPFQNTGARVWRSQNRNGVGSHFSQAATP
jgi:beta-ribofuranosylaminobenzene 5'-phosphate synthase